MTVAPIRPEDGESTYGWIYTEIRHFFEILITAGFTQNPGVLEVFRSNMSTVQVEVLN